MLISVYQSTNKEKKTSDPPLGSPMPPRSLVVTRDTADRNATQYEDLPWGMQHDSESTHAHDGFALPHDTYLTLEAGPYNVQFHTGPQSWHLVPSTPLSQCVHLQHLYIPELLPESVWDGKQCRAPGHVSRPPMSLSQHFTSGAGFRTPPPHRLPPPAAPGLHCTPAVTYQGGTVMIMV